MPEILTIAVRPLDRPCGRQISELIALTQKQRFLQVQVFKALSSVGTPRHRLYRDVPSRVPMPRVHHSRNSSDSACSSRHAPQWQQLFLHVMTEEVQADAAVMQSLENFVENPQRATLGRTFLSASSFPTEHPSPSHFLSDTLEAENEALAGGSETVTHVQR